MKYLEFSFDGESRAPMNKSDDGSHNAIIQLLQDAFIDRPYPEDGSVDEPAEGVDVLVDLLERFSGALSRLVETLQFGDDPLLPTLEEVVEVYHDLWRSTLPEVLLPGQILLGAVMEQPLRTLLRQLERLSQSGAVEEFRQVEIVLEADAELERFNDWLDCLPPEELWRRPEKRFGVGSLATSFLLGWWFGRD